MSLREYKPTSPGRRDTVYDDFSDITTKKPEKSLLAPLTKKGGRKLRKLRKTNKKSKKGVMKKMRMKAGTKKSLTSLWGKFKIF